ncbi:MAG: type I-U CRISPR-associated protein Cas7 [Verrucomicrobiota bacterium]
MSNTLDSTALLADANGHRLVLQATLVPVTGDLFQPAGFPDIGHVIYEAPRPIMEEKGEGKDKKLVQAEDALGNPQWRKEKVCIVDSAASMANHLEAVSLASAQTLELHSNLAGMPYIECYTDEGWPTVRREGPHRLVVTTLSEGHRLASNYFIGAKSKKKTSPVYLVENGQVTNRELIVVMREAMGINDLDNRSHPLPGDWWNVFRTHFPLRPEFARSRHSVSRVGYQDFQSPHCPSRSLRRRSRWSLWREV